MKIFIAVLASALLFCSCSREEPPQVVTAPRELEDPLLEQSRQLVSRLSNEQLAAQLIMSGVDGSDQAPSICLEILQDIPVGAIVLFSYNLEHDVQAVRDLITVYSDAICSNENALLPFIAVDHEGGYVHRFGSLATQLPAPGAFYSLVKEKDFEYAIESIQTAALLSGRELKTMGINMNLAPVAEILDNTNEAFLESRSYGDNALFVTKASSAFMQGMQNAGIACAMKHFPGNTHIDPHVAISRIEKSRAELDQDIMAFAYAIREELPAAIMVSHAVIETVDPQKPASLSKKIMQSWIKDSLSFEGIIISDDFRMKAISLSGYSPEAAIIEALESGADMFMTWPKDLRTVYRTLYTALQEGTVERDRFIDAAERIVYQKLRFGLFQQNPINATIDNSAVLKERTEQYLNERGLR